MSRFFKRTLCLLLAAVCLLSMTGCHGAVGRQSFTIPETFDTSRQYEITFWAKNDTNKAQTNVYNKAIEDFQALYPNITVNMRLYTDYGRIYNDVITNIATDTTPNVCITYPDHIATKTDVQEKTTEVKVEGTGDTRTRTEKRDVTTTVTKTITWSVAATMKGKGA